MNVLPEDVNSDFAQERWQKQIITHVSHEFRTPLTTMKLSVNYLLKHRHKVGDDVVEEKLQRILEQINLLSYSVDNVVRLREAEKSKVVLSKQQIDIAGFLSAEIAEIEKRFNYSHKIEFQLPEYVVGAELDIEILRSIFTNLFNNAVKFSPGKERVWVTLSKESEFIVVKITDQGIGIYENEIDKVFDSFYRGSNATGIEGIGLGLTIVKQGTDMLKGKVKIDSRVGEGTSFYVEIPLQ